MTGPRKPMTRRELEAACRAEIAKALEEGKAGNLDAQLFATIRQGLAARLRAARG